MDPLNWSSASNCSGFPAAIFLMKLLESACIDFARSRLNEPNAAISRGPRLILGPVRWRIKDEPASGSVINFIKVTTSATSGI